MEKEIYSYDQAFENTLKYFNGDELAHRLAPDGEAGDQGGDDERQQHTAERKAAAEGRHHRSGGGAADDAADISHNIVAEAADLAGLPDEAQSLLGPGPVVGGHGMEGPLISGSYRHAHHIKENAQSNKSEKNEERHRKSGPPQQLPGGQAQRRRQGHRDEKDADGPAEPARFPLFLLFFVLLHLVPHMVDKIIQVLCSGNRQR